MCGSECMKMRVVFFVLYCFGSFAMASSQTEDAIDQQLAEYKWSPTVVQFLKKTFFFGYKEHYKRLVVARYLEQQGLYQASATIHCTDIDNSWHNQELETCYANTPQQNTELLSVLRDPDIKKYLTGVTAHTILNGENDKYYEYLVQQSQSVCDKNSFMYSANVCAQYIKIYSSMIMIEE